MSDDELDALCHSMSIDEVARVAHHLDRYISKWYGFCRTAKAERTPEWVEAASKRLEGKTAPCCECGDPYPLADLRFGEGPASIYCVVCRAMPHLQFKGRP
jgi:hypothetical protein